MLSANIHTNLQYNFNNHTEDILAQYTLNNHFFHNNNNYVKEQYNIIYWCDEVYKQISTGIYQLVITILNKLNNKFIDKNLSSSYQNINPVNLQSMSLLQNIKYGTYLRNVHINISSNTQLATVTTCKFATQDINLGCLNLAAILNSLLWKAI